MAKNDVDKLHEQKAERRREGRRGAGGATRRLAAEPRGMRRHTGVQKPTAGRTGEMEAGGGGEIMRA